MADSPGQFRLRPFLIAHALRALPPPRPRRLHLLRLRRRRRGRLRAHPLPRPQRRRPRRRPRLHTLPGSGAHGGVAVRGRRDPGARVRQGVAARRGCAQDGLQRHAQRSDEGLLQEQV